MDNSDADIEAQRSTDVSHDQREGTHFPMNSDRVWLLPRNRLRSHDFSQSVGDGATLPTGDTESVPMFLTDINLLDIFAISGEDIRMTPKIFSGICSGDKKWLEELKSDGTTMARLKSNTGDSILHLAATWGHLELVDRIVSKCPCLLWKPNSRGQIPLHVAAHGGHTNVVQAFVKRFASDYLCKEVERRNPYVLKDENGNTALHLAIKGHYMEMALYLVNVNQDAPFHGNNMGISSLFLAVRAGDVSLVKEILKIIGNGEKSNLHLKLQGKKYLAHAALLAKSIGVLDIILDEYPSLMDELDEDGRTCLSLGANIGYYKGVYNLLKRSTENVYVCNQDGSFPIHMAAEEDHEDIVEEIIKCCPDSKYLLNKLGQNVLHIAAKNGSYNVLSMMEKDMEHLGVWQDVDGNTPLHLAVMNWNYGSITSLAKNSKILKVQNKNGLRARDIAESELKPHYIFKERWTLALLLYIIHSKGVEDVGSLTRVSEPLGPENNRDYVNTLLLVAALVATMTFAAGFTIPGGFNSSDPHLGRATLATNPTLFIFLLLDTLAMQSSVAAIGTLIWAQLGDRAIIYSSLNVALPLLLFALLCMPLAFLFGVVTAVGHVKWLLVIICYISILLFFCAIFLIGPHVILKRPHVSPRYPGYFLVTFMKYRYIFEIIARVISYIFFGCK